MEQLPLFAGRLKRVAPGRRSTVPDPGILPHRWLIND
jgi:hypothetical protein